MKKILDYHFELFLDVKNILLAVSDNYCLCFLHK